MHMNIREGHIQSSMHTDEGDGPSWARTHMKADQLSVEHDQGRSTVTTVSGHVVQQVLFLVPVPSK